MKSNKGFTLIELLAVIVILAIIALIAVPVIMGIVGKAQKSTFKDSAYELVKAGDLLYSTNEMEGAELERKTFTFPDNAKALKVKGELPTDGIMKVYENGEIAMAVTSGKYCATKKYGSKEVVVTENTENCELPKLELGDIIYFDPTLGEKGMLCTKSEYSKENSKAGHKDGCMRWYVYNSDGTESKLILDHNTNGKFASTDISVDALMDRLASDTKNWKAEADLIEIDELLNLIPWYKNEEYTNKDNWYDEYIKEQAVVYMEVFNKLGYTEENHGEIVNLSAKEQIELADKVYDELFSSHSNMNLPKFFHDKRSSLCTIIESEVICQGMGYLTKSEYDDEKIWFVDSEDLFRIRPLLKTSKYVGIRPVITITQ